ncbi:MAG TPA: hydroxymethylbilane synthase [Candidatus Bathyarchaeia archaeon]|nr:hydroxymethylbilane synthase [Candidatus Bathyarchaeia archaeon]
MKIRFGTRGSRLAMVQAGLVADALRGRGVEAQLITIRTSGDRLADVALADFGGKALFVKEIEEAILDGRVDAGVHSLKDLPALLPDGLALAAFPPRADVRDVLLTRTGAGLDDLPRGARVATSSLRRRALLLARRPDLTVEPIRGNVDTRLRKLEEGLCDALVMAWAGLERLGLKPERAQVLDAREFLPAVGQGTLAVEARGSDRAVLEALRSLDDAGTRSGSLAERAFLRRLGAGCHTPVAGLARVEGGTLVMDGLVASVDGRTMIRGRADGAATRAEAVGEKLADDLLARGAGPILAAGGPA